MTKTDLNKSLFLLLLLLVYVIQGNFDYQITNQSVEVFSLSMSSYFINKDSVKNIKMSDDKLMQGILHQSNLLTTLDINSNINKAVSLAYHIYDNLPDNQVKQFVNNTVNKPAQVVANLNNNIIIPNSIINFNENKPNVKINNNAGVYVFTEINTNKQYIGSAMNFNTRLNNHLRMKDGSFYKLVMNNGGWDKFNYGMVYITTNYLETFRDKYPSYILSQGEALYLMHLTHIEARMLEQSLITTCKPYYNQDDKVTFVLTSWNSDWLDNPRMTNILSKPVEIRVNNEVILTVNSKLEASKVVGRDLKTLQRNYINNTLEFWSKTLNQLITVNTVSSIPTYRPYMSTNTTKDVTLDLKFDLELLPPYLIHVYNEDKKFITVFNSLEEAYKTLNPNRYNSLDKFKLDNVRISNYVNKEKLYKSDIGKVYLAWNPLVSIKSGLEVPVLLIDVNLNKAMYFNNRTDAAKYINVTPQNFTYALKSINHVFKNTNYKSILAKPFLIDYPEYLGLKQFNFPKNINLSNYKLK